MSSHPARLLTFVAHRMRTRRLKLAAGIIALAVLAAVCGPVFLPDATVPWRGTLVGGSNDSLTKNDNDYYTIVAERNPGFPNYTEFAARFRNVSTTAPGGPTFSQGDVLYSAWAAGGSGLQIISLWKWSTGEWVRIGEPQPVGIPERLAALTVSNPADFISSNKDVLVRVQAFGNFSSTSGSYLCLSLGDCGLFNPGQ